MLRRSIPLVAGVVCAALAAPAGAASAAPRTAQFKAHLRGTQVVIFSLRDERSAPRTTRDGRVVDCRRFDYADGDQTLRFTSDQPTRLRVVEATSRRFNGGRPLIVPNTFTVAASLTRNAELSEGYRTPGDPCDEVLTRPAPDCGNRYGRMVVSLVDTQGRGGGRDTIVVSAIATGWDPEPSFGKGNGLPLSSSFRTCPFWYAGPAAQEVSQGYVDQVVERLPAKRLFDSRRKKVVVHGSATACWNAAGPIPCGSSPDLDPRPFAGRAIVAFRLTLTRVGPRRPGR
jgi:hypothetical protein